MESPNSTRSPTFTSVASGPAEMTTPVPVCFCRKRMKRSCFSMSGRTIRQSCRARTVIQLSVKIRCFIERCHVSGLVVNVNRVQKHSIGACIQHICGVTVTAHQDQPINFHVRNRHCRCFTDIMCVSDCRTCGDHLRSADSGKSTLSEPFSERIIEFPNHIASVWHGCGIAPVSMEVNICAGNPIMRHMKHDKALLHHCC